MIDVDGLMSALSTRRSVFHSEADFQHELAWEARLQFPKIRVRLEQPFPGRTSGAIDLVINREGVLHAIEVKYLTSLYSGEIDGEHFRLKNHGAQDIRRYDVCRDIERMEAFCSETGGLGSVIVLTNDPYYWRGRTNAGTCAEAFDVSGRSELFGELRWADHTGGTKKGREAAIILRSRYAPSWRDYSDVGGSRGQFRYFHLAVNSSFQPLT